MWHDFAQLHSIALRKPQTSTLQTGVVGGGGLIFVLQVKLSFGGYRIIGYCSYKIWPKRQGVHFPS